MDTIAYSIIIPHKNIPVLLTRCLESVPQRADIEVIVVDDNSDDSIVDFDNFPGTGRPNTKIIFDKSGKGAGHARNLGIDNSRGEFLLFVDADDFFNYCISDILDQSKKAKEDIIYFNANSVDTLTYLSANRSRHLNRMIKMWENKRKHAENSLRYEFGEPWCKIVRRSLVVNHDIRFDETPIHNDTTFSYKVGFYADTISIDKRAGYCITVRSGSTSVSANEAKELIRINVFARAERFYIDNHIDALQPYHYEQVAHHFLRSLSLGCRSFKILKDYQLPICISFVRIVYYIVRILLSRIYSFVNGKS